jgi:hypothetical protein
MMSISTIRPSLTVKPAMANGLRPRITIAPAAPLTIAGEWCERSPALQDPPRDRLCAFRRHLVARGSVDTQDCIRVEQGDQAFEVACTRRGQERVYDPALLREIGLRFWRGILDTPPCAARQLARCGWCAADDGRNLLEGQPEHVVKDEREPLCRPQRVQHDQQREPHRVGEQRLVLRIGAVLHAHDRFGQPPGVLLAARAAGSKHVEATRATTVVSQPPRLSIAAPSARFRRNQDSCMASSASLIEPSIR